MCSPYNVYTSSAAAGAHEGMIIDQFCFNAHIIKSFIYLKAWREEEAKNAKILRHAISHYKLYLTFASLFYFVDLYRFLFFY